MEDVVDSISFPSGHEEGTVDNLIEWVRQDLGNRTTICILGSEKLESATAEELAVALASALNAAVGNQVVFLTSGLAGVQEVFAKRCAKIGGTVINVLPAGRECDYGVGRDVALAVGQQQHSHIFGQIGDVYVSIEGGPAVAQEAETAFARGAYVVPIVRSGGASGGMYGYPAGALQKPHFADEASWSLLSSCSASNEESAQAAARLVSGFIFKHGCEAGHAQEIPTPAPTRVEAPSVLAARPLLLAVDETNLADVALLSCFAFVASPVLHHCCGQTSITCCQLSRFFALVWPALAIFIALQVRGSFRSHGATYTCAFLGEVLCAAVRRLADVGEFLCCSVLEAARSIERRSSARQSEIVEMAASQADRGTSRSVRLTDTPKRRTSFNTEGVEFVDCTTEPETRHRAAAGVGGPRKWSWSCCFGRSLE